MKSENTKEGFAATDVAEQLRGIEYRLATGRPLIYRADSCRGLERYPPGEQ